MRLLRKIFNFPNKEEEVLIKQKVDLIWDLAKSRADFLNRESQKKYHQVNDTCPKCESMAVVNKFIRFQGEGRGFGHFTADTNEINNCNNCGNQWRKFEFKKATPTSVIGGWLDDMYLYRGDKEKEIENTKIREFNGWQIYAESIHNVLWEIKGDCRVSTREYFGLINLREKFKSVYDIKKQ